VTPLQLAIATSALANGGTVWQPELLQRIISPDGTVQRELQPKARRKLHLAPAATGPVLGGLAEQARSATGQAGPTAALNIAGLAAPAAPTANGPGQPGLNAWWTGAAPMSDPQLVVTVLVAGGNDPEAAAPVARAMFDAYFQPSPGDAASHG
jgi:cell division protein FtsI/penicillin-binding protein 2